MKIGFRSRRGLSVKTRLTFDLLSIVRIGKLMPPRRQKAPSLLHFCDWDSWCDVQPG